jgi:DNA repair protein RadB
VIGPLEEETITTFYGPPGVGKTTLCFQYCIDCLKQNKQVIYVDTEGGFSVERLKLIDEHISLKDIIVFSPKSFEEQIKVISRLNKDIKNAKHVGLIIVDSLVMLYRLKLGDAPQKINSELAEQLRLLTELSRTFKIPVLVTNQMYKHFETKESKMVGGSILEYWSKTIVELDKENGDKTLQLKKHKFKPESDKLHFEITNSGLVEKKFKFSLFKS